MSESISVEKAIRNLKQSLEEVLAHHKPVVPMMYVPASWVGKLLDRVDTLDCLAHGFVSVQYHQEHVEVLQKRVEGLEAEVQGMVEDAAGESM